MTEPLALSFAPFDPEALAQAEGRIAVLVEAEGRPGAEARRLDGLTRKAVSRLLASPGWAKAKAGEAMQLAFPAGLAAEGLLVVKVPRKAGTEEARKAGAAIAKMRGTGPLTVVLGSFPQAGSFFSPLSCGPTSSASTRPGPRSRPGP
jgi:leucyl aminopeptidase